MLSRASLRRRDFAALIAAATPVAAAAQTQKPTGPPPVGQPPAPTGEDKLAKARANVQRASERLGQMEVAMDTQPAFQFRP